MKAIESRILVTVKNDGPTEKIGMFEMPDDPNGLDTAEVVSVGGKVEEVAVGDTVLIYKGAGKEFTRDGQKYRLIALSEIVVVL